jgi:hypothetical protein
LINSNILKKDGQFALPVLHLWHIENDRSNLEANISRLFFSTKLKKTKAAKSALNSEVNE